jgi:hypothetical protein
VDCSVHLCSCDFLDIGIIHFEHVKIIILCVWLCARVVDKVIIVSQITTFRDVGFDSEITVDCTHLAASIGI